MTNDEPNLAARFLKGVLYVASLPFFWAASVLSPSRESIQAAEQAKFDTRRWTPELLKHLDWRRFEETCAAYFQALGCITLVEPSRFGAGADIGLCTGSEAVSVLVQCKAWDVYRVGIKPLKALREAMTRAGVREGVLVTSGRFTLEAATYASAENISLLDGSALLAALDALPPEKALALLKLATSGDFLTPTCPRCDIKMALRSSTRGGRKFWGCRNYPRCKETVFGGAPV